MGCWERNGEEGVCGAACTSLSTSTWIGRSQSLSMWTEERLLELTQIAESAKGRNGQSQSIHQEEED